MISGEAAYLIELLRAALYGEPAAPAPEGLDWGLLYRIARRHAVEVMAYHAMLRLDPSPDEAVMGKLKQCTLRQMARDMSREYEIEHILESFEQAGLDCMPLKGAIIRRLYPATEMRYMSDFDLLADPRRLSESGKLLLSLDYESYRRDTHHDIFYKKGFPLFVELHKMLIVGELGRYFGTGFERAVLREGKAHVYDLSAEDYYIYLIGHMAYHFAHGGIGVRSILDIRVYLDHYQNQMRWDYVNGELDRCGLRVFMGHLTRLSEAWFAGGESDVFLQQLGEYVLDSWVLGTEENSRILDAVKQYREDGDFKTAKTKAGYRIVFPTRENMRFLYPSLSKHPWLLPACHLHRWGKTLLFRKQNVSRLFETAGAPDHVISRTKQLYKKLGIDHL